MTSSEPPSSFSQPAQLAGPALSEPVLQILFKELDLLQQLYSQTDQSAQQIFNFYLTLVTSVAGGIVLLLQFTSSSEQPLLPSAWLIAGLAFFVAAIGSVYLSALAGKYGHLARYAFAIDQLRKLLVQSVAESVPEIYRDFLAVQGEVARSYRERSITLLTLIMPPGTYAFFMAMTNSLALAVGMCAVVLQEGVGLGESVFPGLVAAMLAFTINNIYAHLAIRAITARLGVRVYTQDSLRFLAGRQ